jgi:PAS domain S-box-containing protein
VTTILVADDIGANRYMLTSLLEGHGYQVVVASDGAEAFRLAQAAPPDLIITDILMPVMDGFELCRRWKRDERLRRVPLVIYTATYTDPKDERLAVSLGADRFLVKPQKPDTIIEVVRQVLEAAARNPSVVRAGPDGDEVELLEQHRDALTRKLEKKVMDLESEVAKRQAAETELREKERKYRLLAENSIDVVWSVNLDRRVTYVSPSVRKLLGFSPEELAGRSLRELLGPAAQEVLEREVLRPAVDRRPGDESGVFELEHARSDGSTVWAETSVNVMRDEEGDIVGFHGVSRDVSRRRQAELETRRALEKLEKRSRELQGLLDGAKAILLGGEFRVAARQIFDRARELTGARAGYVALSRESGETDDVVFVESGGPASTSDPEALARAGADVWPHGVFPDDGIGGARRSAAESPARACRVLFAPLRIQGETVGVMGLADKQGEFDEDDERVATALANLAALSLERSRAEEERQSLQSQLVQTQKIESIGRLAGGVAHDFNNLLSAVLAYADFALEAVRPDDPLRADLEEIRRAGERAAVLTRQLLAFSRKQILEPEIIDLNRVVSGIDSMLRRLLGEDIEIEARLADDAGNVLADPGQIEQVIMNLAVNARDAMPRGGKLVLETANVVLDKNFAEQHMGAAPGRYVMLAVTDTGVGMDPATKEHLFEPFFTTKAKGTGLGLSTVYGIVKQSGGSVWVESELGRGTTFRAYLPHVDAPAVGACPPPAPALTRGTETLLLVEDEDAVREVAERILRSAGYAVLVADGGSAALRIADEHPARIHLLLTDLVMPHMGGCQLADELCLRRPELRVLYMSGYADDAVVRGIGIGRGAHFLGKPFAPADLTRKVREALDGPPSGKAE